MRATPVVPNPIMLYVRLTEASAALAREIQRLDNHDPTLAMPLEAAWIILDDLIEQLPAALESDAQRQRPEDDTQRVDPGAGPPPPGR